jgi:hypothetical protein
MQPWPLEVANRFLQTYIGPDCKVLMRDGEAALAEADARLISWIDMKNHFTAR